MCISIYKIYKKWVLISLATFLPSATEGQKAFSGRISRVACHVISTVEEQG